MGTLAVAESKQLAHIALAAGEAGEADSRGLGLGASPSGVSAQEHGRHSTSGLLLL